MQRHTFRDITLFVAAYEERSFTLAAARENATQSGVSQHIRKLEAGYGVRLFERQGTAVLPTPAGEIYYRHCIEILRASTEAVARLSAHRPGETVTLSVGLMPTVSRYGLGGPLLRTAEENPNARIRVSEGFSADLTARVKGGELDFAIVPGGASEPEPGLRITPFCTTPERLVFGPASPLYGAGEVAAADLEGVALVVPTARNIRRQQIESFLTRHRIRPRRLLELDSMMATLDILRRSDHISILPALLVVREIAAGTPLGDLYAPPRQTINLATALVVIERARDPVPPLGQRFLTLLREECLALQAAAGLDA